ncbi:hypothetical protein DVU_2096 [Nitratidesulfovibrio vulgaris str. Hildenborough]|uniref:Uncharacterized protein n=1 Tax=Nitratidesulfovibrio vulgaris (strain ATCC 29579 / DSM 644 / CCUG 34227 / NCIMB 8303 / VKM B-1760 / Hildenborough) TaxID=882 RepID=Q72AA1_NITV2|nr:hypothetical protein DVU_2096 [Nitratidesulfovibrio vulgaris str. Hildenborough]
MVASPCGTCFGCVPCACFPRELLSWQVVAA